MGCGSCGSGGCSSEGCGQNGGCATGGCNKLNTYDWLGNMLSPDKTEVDNVYEIRFKNTRKSFYRNVNGLRLYTGDCVVVESDRGYDVGSISMGGVLAELQMKKKRHKVAAEELPRIYRKAADKDVELLEKVRGREQETLVRTREIIEDLRLDMKLSDVEFQGDNAKAIFYYIADHRVDFRELIKILAREFRIRVEMKQIGLRHEAGLVGGIGSCGRELCCSTWLTDFKTVSTSAARYQNLSLNPMKISGLCGRLKCCLNFELEVYLDALQDFPEVNTLETTKGTAFLQKTDIFKGMMWFSYKGETSWHPIRVEEVKRIMSLNEKGQRAEALIVKPELTLEQSLDFVDVVGTNLPEVEKRGRGKGKGKGRGKGRGGNNRGRNQARRGNNQGRNRKNNPENKAQGDNKENPNKETSKKQNPRNRNQGRNQNRNRNNRNKQAEGEGGDKKEQGANKPQGNSNRRNKHPRRNNRNPQNRGGQNRGGKGRGNRNSDDKPSGDKKE
ncbi:MAG: regulatory iron-sulfur-containing complex subunit RicT [Bacteroidota bacterium]